MLTITHFTFPSRQLPWLLAWPVFITLVVLTSNRFTPQPRISKTTLSATNKPSHYVSVIFPAALPEKVSYHHVKGRSVGIGEPLPPWQRYFVEKTKDALVAGKKLAAGERKFLVLGMTTVFRKDHYLEKTLSSLIQESDEEERRDVLIVIYLADASSENNAKQLTFIKERYQEYLDSGFFQVIESCEEIYPPMDFVLTKRTYNHPKEKVLWRAKQVVDYTFVLAYSSPIADYYFVMEDDVVASTQYITAIREFILSRKEKHWTALEFTSFLSIGLLFQAKDFPKLVQLLLMFYQDQPVDEIMRIFITLQVPEWNLKVRRIPSLFQHIGLNSSLPNKIQDLTDSTFNMANRQFSKNRNPPAVLITSMKIRNEFVPEYAFRSTPGFFWGIAKSNDTFDIVFPTPLNISRVVIITGIVDPKSKIRRQIKDGVLEMSDKFQRMSTNNNSAVCNTFKNVAFFQKGNGNVDVNLSERSSRNNNVEGSTSQTNLSITSVQCIRVRIGPRQKSSVVIREIQIFK